MLCDFYNNKQLTKVCLLTVCRAVIVCMGQLPYSFSIPQQVILLCYICLWCSRYDDVYLLDCPIIETSAGHCLLCYICYGVHATTMFTIVLCDTSDLYHSFFPLYCEMMWAPGNRLKAASTP